MLVNAYRNEPCIVCGTESQTVAHHVKTKGSGGDDVESNLVAVCFLCHRDFHDKGLKYMANKNEKVKNWLIGHGWQFDEYSQKWLSPKQD